MGFVVFYLPQSPRQTHSWCLLPTGHLYNASTCNSIHVVIALGGLDLCSCLERNGAARSPPESDVCRVCDNGGVSF